MQDKTDAQRFIGICLSEIRDIRKVISVDKLNCRDFGWSGIYTVDEEIEILEDILDMLGAKIHVRPSFGGDPLPETKRVNAREAREIVRLQRERFKELKCKITKVGQSIGGVQRRLRYFERFEELKEAYSCTMRLIKELQKAVKETSNDVRGLSVELNSKTKDLVD